MSVSDWDQNISGEENLLLDQALKKGLKIRFFPMYIGSHPALRTGILFTPELVRSKVPYMLPAMEQVQR